MSHIAHAGHPIKSPLDDDSVRRLLDRGLTKGHERVLDLRAGVLQRTAEPAIPRAEAATSADGAFPALAPR